MEHNEYEVQLSTIIRASILKMEYYYPRLMKLMNRKPKSKILHYIIIFLTTMI